MSVLRTLWHGLMSLGGVFYHPDRDPYLETVREKREQAERIASGNVFADALQGTLDDERRDRR